MANISDQRTHTIYIIRKDDTTKGLYEDQTQGFGLIRSDYISKSYCKHNIGSPVISPNVNLLPVSSDEVFLGEPTILYIYLRHKVEEYGQKMSVAEVKQKYLTNGPILLLISRFNDIDLQFLKPFKVAGHLGNGNQFEISYQLRVSIQIRYQNSDMQDINKKLFFYVAAYYIPDKINFFALWYFNRNHVYHEIEETERQGYRLKQVSRKRHWEFESDIECVVINERKLKQKYNSLIHALKTLVELNTLNIPPFFSVIFFFIVILRLWSVNIVSFDLFEKAYNNVIYFLFFYDFFKLFFLKFSFSILIQI